MRATKGQRDDVIYVVIEGINVPATDATDTIGALEHNEVVYVLNVDIRLTSAPDGFDTTAKPRLGPHAKAHKFLGAVRILLPPPVLLRSCTRPTTRLTVAPISA